VSVVIPCFNASRTVRTTVETVLHQSLRDIEVIIVDDGSTDDLGSVVQPFLARDPRVRLVRQTNRGLAGARNRGIEEARAEFVAPIDADDVWHPQFLEQCVTALESEPPAPFAYAYVFRMDEDGRLLPFLGHRTPPRHDVVGLITLNSVSCGSAAVFRRGAVLAAGGYDEAMAARQLHGAEDWKLIVTLASKAMPVLIPRHLVGYRLDARSMSQRDPARQLRAVRAVIQDLRTALPSIPPHVFKDGETMMIAWLLPAFATRGDWASFAREFATAYVLNPRWFLNPQVRRVHMTRLSLLLRQVGRLPSQRGPGPRLRDATIAGERPFAYLPPADDQAPS
jgi:glycosyltransferase involved in cell wall biosynthesis